MPSEAVLAQYGVYDTQIHLNDQFVGLGRAYSFTFGGHDYEFEKNTNETYDNFDARNLYICRFLNLRGSLFCQVDAKYMLSLEYIDVAFTRIREVDLMTCKYLKMVVTDDNIIIHAK